MAGKCGKVAPLFVQSPELQLHSSLSRKISLLKRISHGRLDWRCAAPSPCLCRGRAFLSQKPSRLCFRPGFFWVNFPPRFSSDETLLPPGGRHCCADHEIWRGEFLDHCVHHLPSHCRSEDHQELAFQFVFSSLALVVTLEFGTVPHPSSDIQGG